MQAVKDKEFDAVTYPFLYAWMSFAAKFTPKRMSAWVDAQPATAKTEAQTEVDECDDLFGDDDDDDDQDARMELKAKALAAK